MLRAIAIDFNIKHNRLRRRLKPFDQKPLLLQKTKHLQTKITLNFNPAPFYGAASPTGNLDLPGDFLNVLTLSGKSFQDRNRFSTAAVFFNVKINGFHKFSS